MASALCLCLSLLVSSTLAASNRKMLQPQDQQSAVADVVGSALAATNRKMLQQQQAAAVADVVGTNVGSVFDGLWNHTFNGEESGCIFSSPPPPKAPADPPPPARLCHR